MLVLTRKLREAVVVIDAGGADCLIRVTVLERTGDRVKLGFEAGKELPIHRLEVWDRICAAGRPDPPAAAPVTPAT